MCTHIHIQLAALGLIAFTSAHLCVSQSLVLALIIPPSLSYLFFFLLKLTLLFPVSSFYFWLQEQLDVALSKTCKHFDDLHYTKVQLAYSLLGKTQVSGLTTLCSLECKHSWMWSTHPHPRCPHLLHNSYGFTMSILKVCA